MRYSTYINNSKCIEWGLSSSQGALFDLLNQLSSWANHIMIDNKLYYHISRNKIIEELPLFYSKSDTVYRHFLVLQEKGLILYSKQQKKDIICLTDKGKTWNEIRNSEMNPTKLGNESESNSEMNPTYNITNKHNIYNNNTNKDPLIFIERQDFKDLVSEWLDYKVKIKAPLKEVSYKSCYDKLMKFSKGDIVVAREIIGNSVSNGYKGFFEPKVNGNSPTPKKSNDDVFKEYLNRGK